MNPHIQAVQNMCSKGGTAGFVLVLGLVLGFRVKLNVSAPLGFCADTSCEISTSSILNLGGNNVI